MPAVGSGLLTHDYMEKIERKDLWCPRSVAHPYYDNGSLAVYKQCVKEPTKNRLYEHLLIEQNRAGIELGMNPQHLPNKDWMMICLSTLNPEHTLFSRQYVPVIRNNNVVHTVFPDPGGMYANLPKLAKGGGKARRGLNGGLTK